MRRWRIFAMVFAASLSLQFSALAQISPATIEKANSNRPFQGIDYLHFWLVPQAESHLRQSGRRSTVYRKESHQEVVEFAGDIAERQKSERFNALLEKNKRLYASGIEPTGAPFLYAVTGSLQTGDFDFDYGAFQIASTLCYLGGVCLICHCIGFGQLSSIVFAAVLIAFFQPLQVDFAVANVNRIQLFFIAVFIWLSHHEKTTTAGFVIGAAVAFKVSFVPALLAVMAAMLACRRWLTLSKLCVGSLLGGGFGWGMGSLYFRSTQCWFDWRDYMQQFALQNQSSAIGNYSLQQAFDLNSPLLALALMVVCLLFVAIVFQKTTVANSDDHRLIMFAVICGLLVMLVSSPLVWSHYFVMLLPAIILLIFAMMGDSDQEEFTLAGIRNSRRLIFAFPLLLIALPTVPLFSFLRLNTFTAVLVLQAGVLSCLAMTLTIYARGATTSLQKNVAKD